MAARRAYVLVWQIAILGVALAIWQWGFMERVSTGLHMMEIGMKAEGWATLAVADRIYRG